MSRIAVFPELDPTTYQRSILHADDCTWLEKNCYVDIWIEVLHALRLNPLAMLPFTVALDFEGDQWTFFKPPHDELRDLYGIDVQELYVWRPLIDHAIEQLGAGKLISTEADAYWLPDTYGTTYRQQHSKTTIVLADIDVEARRLRYFHNAGYYSLDAEDFVQLFGLDTDPDPSFMPLFAELVRIDRIRYRPESELASLSLDLLRRHLLRRPTTNPITRFRERFESDLPSLRNHGLPFYHAWAFGTIRQLGSAFELAALNLQWLSAQGAGDFRAPYTAFQRISMTCKTLILKVARAVSARRALNNLATFGEIEEAWAEGMATLATAMRCAGPVSEDPAYAPGATANMLQRR